MELDRKFGGTPVRTWGSRPTSAPFSSFSWNLADKLKVVL
jgi:hypothetical protein